MQRAQTGRYEREGLAQRERQLVEDAAMLFNSCLAGNGGDLNDIAVLEKTIYSTNLICRVYTGMKRSHERIAGSIIRLRGYVCRKSRYRRT